MKKYEWAIIGGGIAGISIAEILTREGHSCVLIEKNKDLASETSREFHEWLHTGALYTLIPDRLVTIKFILGAIDDLLEYYSSYDSMNLKATEKGLVVNRVKAARRNASKLQRTPKWADLNAIKQFYLNCPKGYEVDHIIPLQGVNVSGFHVLSNLQYLTKSENSRKRNKY